MTTFLRTDKTGADLIAVCDAALADRRAGDSTPEVEDVVFDHAVDLGWCQQNTREAVEACAYGQERVWPDTRCCATRTCQVLRTRGYGTYDLSSALPGDLIYWSPCGGTCHTCGQDAGHVGILHHQRNGRWYVWQNTSYRGLGMTIIPLQSWQQRPVGIFRLFPSGEPTVPSGATPALVVLDGRPVEGCYAQLEADGRMTLVAAPLLEAIGLQSLLPSLQQAGAVHAAGGRAYVSDLKGACAGAGWILAYRLQPQGPRLYPVPSTD